MKTNIPATFAVISTAVLLINQAANAQAAPQFDPATGLMSTNVAGQTRIDPVTGLVASPDDAASLDGSGAMGRLQDKMQGWPISEVRALIADGKFDEALQRMRAIRRQLKNRQALRSLLTEWADLGRRYSKAGDALVEIRDHDVGEFSSGRGSLDLFIEVQSINIFLNDNNATVALFKRIDASDKRVAEQCYPFVENLLVQNGEYALCMSYIGDPEARFEALRKNLEMRRQWQATMKKTQEATRPQQEKMAAEMARIREQSQERMRQMRPFVATNASGAPLTPPGFKSYLVTPDDMGRQANEYFVAQVSGLIEILVATDQKAEAVKIRDEAASVLDDSRLASAVFDAQQKLAK